MIAGAVQQYLDEADTERIELPMSPADDLAAEERGAARERARVARILLNTCANWDRASALLRALARSLGASS